MGKTGETESEMKIGCGVRQNPHPRQKPQSFL